MKELIWSENDKIKIPVIIINAPAIFLIEISSLKNKNPHHIPQKIVTALFALAIESGIDFKTCCHKTAYTNSIKIIAQYRKQKFTDKKSKPDAFFPRTV